MATVKIGDPFLQVLFVVVPSQFVDSDCRRLLQIEECFGQQVLIDVMHQGSELQLAVVAS
jgi:hypothetical protein